MACEIKAEFFHPDRIFILLQMVMNNCLQLSQGELEEWSEDPETFYTAQEGAYQLCVYEYLRTRKFIWVISVCSNTLLPKSQLNSNVVF